MRIPYGYVLKDELFTIDTEKASVIKMIFDYYLAGASLGKVADMLFAKNIPSPTGNAKWTRAAIDKLLSNPKYIPIIGFEVYTDTQFEKEHRCNIDYDKASAPRKAVRYQSPAIEM